MSRTKDLAQLYSFQLALLLGLASWSTSMRSLGLVWFASALSTHGKT